MTAFSERLGTLTTNRSPGFRVWLLDSCVLNTGVCLAIPSISTQILSLVRILMAELLSFETVTKKFDPSLVNHDVGSNSLVDGLRPAGIAALAIAAICAARAVST